MFKKVILIVVLAVVSFQATAQELLEPSFGFSHKKVSYVTLLDGTTIEGEIRDIDRKKGLIEYVKIKDADGKKHKLEAEEIQYMYLPPSGFDTFNKLGSKVYDAQKWYDKNLNSEYIKEGYVYFELADVQVKKKQRKLLMQLLNPAYSQKVKIYHDPLAKKTMSIGMGNITLAGGIAKSYYISKAGAVAYRAKKKAYDEDYVSLWEGCETVDQAGEEKPVWRDLGKHALAFSDCQE